MNGVLKFYIHHGFEAVTEKQMTAKYMINSVKMLKSWTQVHRVITSHLQHTELQLTSSQATRQQIYTVVTSNKALIVIITDEPVTKIT